MHKENDFDISKILSEYYIYSYDSKTEVLKIVEDINKNLNESLYLRQKTDNNIIHIIDVNEKLIQFNNNSFNIDDKNIISVRNILTSLPSRTTHIYLSNNDMGFQNVDMVIEDMEKGYLPFESIDSNMHTIAYYAVSEGNVKAIQKLIENNFNFLICGVILFYATVKKQTEIANLIYDTIKDTDIQKSKDNALFEALKINDYKKAKTEIEKGAYMMAKDLKTNQTPLEITQSNIIKLHSEKQKANEAFEFIGYLIDYGAK